MARACTPGLESKLACNQQSLSNLTAVPQQHRSNLTNAQRRARQQGGAAPPVAASTAACPAATCLPFTALAAWQEGAAAAGQQRVAQRAERPGALFSVCLQMGGDGPYGLGWEADFSNKSYVWSGMHLLQLSDHSTHLAG